MMMICARSVEMEGRWCVGEDRTAFNGFRVGFRSLWNVMAYAAGI